VSQRDRNSLDKQFRMVASYVPLGQNANNKGCQKRAVDTDHEYADVVENNGRVVVPSAAVREQAMQEVKRRWGRKPDQETDRDPLIPAADGE